MIDNGKLRRAVARAISLAMDGDLAVKDIYRTVREQMNPEIGEYERQYLPGIVENEINRQLLIKGITLPIPQQIGDTLPAKVSSRQVLASD